MTEALIMWVVYDHPKDHDGYIARKWLVDGDGARATIDSVHVKHLEAFREMMLRHGRVCIARDATDDPVIMETWV